MLFEHQKEVRDCSISGGIDFRIDVILFYCIINFVGSFHYQCWV